MYLAYFKFSIYTYAKNIKDSFNVLDINGT